MKFPGWVRKVDRPTGRETPEVLWFGFTRCGCVCAWSVSSPAELSEESKRTLDEGPGVTMWLKLKNARVSKRHQIVEGETWRAPYGRIAKEFDYMDWGIDGCPMPGGHYAPGDVLDAWFPPVS